MTVHCTYIYVSADYVKPLPGIMPSKCTENDKECTKPDDHFWIKEWTGEGVRVINCIMHNIVSTLHV